ncbi:GD12996 [Drosophila simulans]|uniref:GD12996 n=1 Tax=Drosophila simulans TaxID=7240 RepID=B4QLN5_DROSI|nr:GD12996 [Drosophila simulans]
MEMLIQMQMQMDDANGTGDGGDLPQSISMCKVLGWRPQKSGSLAKGISIFSLRFLRLVYRSLGRHQCDARRCDGIRWVGMRCTESQMQQPG